MIAPHYADERVTVHHGDCLDVLATLPDASVDAVVTDPPYELTSGSGRGGFMGKKWDGTGIAFRTELWQECLRVLKPGGFLVSFGGTRTFHRLACAIEDAGFEIRDSIGYGHAVPVMAWTFGSGFPKSLNVSRALSALPACTCGGAGLSSEGGSVVDAVAPSRAVGAAVGAEPGTMPLAGASAHLTRRERSEMIAASPAHRGQLDVHGVHEDFVGKSLPVVLGSPTVTRAAQGEQVVDLVGGIEVDPEALRDQVVGEQPVCGAAVGAGSGIRPCANCGGLLGEVPAGLGTALKPAWEPIVVARKPLGGTVAANVLAHGTGALNIGACRVGDGTDRTTGGVRQGSMPQPMSWGQSGRERVERATGGRWPANVILSHAPDCDDACVDGCPVAELDAQSGVTVSSARVPTGRDTRGVPNGSLPVTRFADTVKRGHVDSGGASRFFPTFRYQAKAPTSERPKVDGIAHPTVKPLSLMQFLVRLVTLPGGTVLDPFAGSGTTAEACLLEGFQCIAVEREADYLPLITARIARVLATTPTLFDPTTPPTPAEAAS